MPVFIDKSRSRKTVPGMTTWSLYPFPAIPGKWFPKANTTFYCNFKYLNHFLKTCSRKMLSGVISTICNIDKSRFKFSSSGRERSVWNIQPFWNFRSGSNALHYFPGIEQIFRHCIELVFALILDFEG